MSKAANNLSPIFYAGELSYYSGKARSYLNYKKITFEERLATPTVYKTIIMPRIGYPMIPVTVFSDEKIIQDTTELMDYIEELSPEPSITPNGPKQQFVSSLMELYGDEWLVIPAMHYRWAHNRDFALAEFGKLALPDGTPEEQYVAGEKAATRFEGSVPLLGVSPDMAPAVEKSYIALLHELNTHFEHHNFLLGGRPCAGDFGLIGPLYAHLYRDPASGEIMKREAPAVAKWVERMIAVPFFATGDFLADDMIPETLIPVLRRQFREQGPCLLDLIEKLSALKENDPTKDIPRAIGMHTFTLEGTSGNRIILPYTQWMAQRAFEPIETHSTDDKILIHNLLKEIGGDDFIELKFQTPIERDQHKLVWRR